MVARVLVVGFLSMVERMNCWQVADYAVLLARISAIAGDYAEVVALGIAHPDVIFEPLFDRRS
jgi:hypothetical protein